MSAPPRLIESGSGFESKLLRAARLETPSHAGRERAIAAASAVTVGACAGILVKSGLLTASKTWSWLLGIGASVGVAGVAVFAAASFGSSGPSPPVHSSVEARVASSVAPTAPAVSAVSTAPTATEQVRDTPRVAVTAATAVKRQRPRALSSAVLSPKALVEDELTFLRQAKVRIAGNDPRGALETLDSHEAAYPQSAFSEEAAALRVEAWVATGDVARVKRAADAFLKSYPESPYARRVRSAAARVLDEGRIVDGLPIWRTENCSTYIFCNALRAGGHDVKATKALSAERFIQAIPETPVEFPPPAKR